MRNVLCRNAVHSCSAANAPHLLLLWPPYPQWSHQQEHARNRPYTEHGLPAMYKPPPMQYVNAVQAPCAMLNALSVQRGHHYAPITTWSLDMSARSWTGRPLLLPPGLGFQTKGSRMPIAVANILPLQFQGHWLPPGTTSRQLQSCPQGGKNCIFGLRHKATLRVYTLGGRIRTDVSLRLWAHIECIVDGAEI